MPLPCLQSFRYSTWTSCLLTNSQALDTRSFIIRSQLTSCQCQSPSQYPIQSYENLINYMFLKCNILVFLILKPAAHKEHSSPYELLTAPNSFLHTELRSFHDSHFPTCISTHTHSYTLTQFRPSALSLDQGLSTLAKIILCCGRLFFHM